MCSRFTKKDKIIIAIKKYTNQYHQEDALLKIKGMIIMNYKKLTVILCTAIFFASLSFSSANASSNAFKLKPSNFRVALSRLGAKSIAVHRFGRNITIISNRKLRSSGCRRITFRTSQRAKETIKICKNRITPKTKIRNTHNIKLPN